MQDHSSVRSQEHEGHEISGHARITHLLLRALTIPLILLIVILGTLLWATQHLTGSVQEVDRTDRVIGETEDVLRFATAMETGLRGYLLTGRAEYRESYISADRGIDSEISDVRQLLSDGVAEQRLQTIATALTEWRKYARRSIQLRAGGEEFTSYDANPDAQHLMNTIRGGCQQLIAMQESLHEERVQRSALATKVVTVSCILLFFAFLVVITSFTIRQVRSLDRVFQDSHEARLAAEESAQRLRHAYEAGKMWSCQIDVETGRIRRSNESMRMEWDADLLEEDLSAWYERVHPEDRERMRELMSAVLAGRPGYEASFRVRSKDGSYRWIYSRGSWVKHPDGKAVVSGVAMDFTEEKSKEESLRRMAQLLDLAYEPILVRDVDDRIVYWNSGATRLYEWTSQEATGKGSHDLLRTEFPQDRAKVLAEFKENGHWEGELVHRAKSGESRVVASHWILRQGKDGWPDTILETSFDLTERKRSEQTLIRSEKLASVGRMAATIAHEINNPLAAAMNAMFLATLDRSLSAEARHNLDVAEHELERVAHIAKQTLGFYKETGKPVSLRLPELVDGLLDLYGPKLRNKSIRVERKYDIDTTVVGIEGELRQVLSNLISNSIDALPEHGTLEVRMSGPVHLHGQRGMLQLTIADTGMGVEAKDLKHIFEPFFTTKDTIGTGLGLWVTRELINKHEGLIRVRSRVGEGTVFTVWLPLERRHTDRMVARAC